MTDPFAPVEPGPAAGPQVPGSPPPFAPELVRPHRLHASSAGHRAGREGGPDVPHPSRRRAPGRRRRGDIRHRAGDRSGGGRHDAWRVRQRRLRQRDGRRGPERRRGVRPRRRLRRGRPGHGDRRLRLRHDDDPQGGERHHRHGQPGRHHDVPCPGRGDRGGRDGREAGPGAGRHRGWVRRPGNSRARARAASPGASPGGRRRTAPRRGPSPPRTSRSSRPDGPREISCTCWSSRTTRGSSGSSGGS